MSHSNSRYGAARDYYTVHAQQRETLTLDVLAVRVRQLESNADSMLENFQRVRADRDMLAEHINRLEAENEQFKKCLITIDKKLEELHSQDKLTLSSIGNITAIIRRARLERILVQPAKSGCKPGRKAYEQYRNANGQYTPKGKE